MDGKGIIGALMQAQTVRRFHGVRKPLPASLRQRSDAESIDEDVEPYLATTAEERLKMVEALCRFTAEQIAASPDGRRVLERQDPRSTESFELWLRLVRAARKR